jgi:hypothetical protein
VVGARTEVARANLVKHAHVHSSHVLHVATLSQVLHASHKHCSGCKANLTLNPFLFARSLSNTWHTGFKHLEQERSSPIHLVWDLLFTFTPSTFTPSVVLSDYTVEPSTPKIRVEGFPYSSTCKAGQIDSIVVPVSMF